MELGELRYLCLRTKIWPSLSVPCQLPVGNAVTSIHSRTRSIQAVQRMRRDHIYSYYVVCHAALVRFRTITASLLPSKAFKIIKKRDADHVEQRLFSARDCANDVGDVTGMLTLHSIPPSQVQYRALLCRLIRRCKENSMPVTLTLTLIPSPSTGKMNRRGNPSLFTG